MKKIDKHIEEEVENTLQAFDGIQRARPKPFLYTRLQARLEGKSGKSIAVGILSPAFQRLGVIMIIFIVAFNIYTAARFFISPAATDTLSTSEQLFVDEYYPATPTLYNISESATNP